MLGGPGAAMPADDAIKKIAKDMKEKAEKEKAAKEKAAKEKAAKEKAEKLANGEIEEKPKKTRTKKEK